MYLKNKEFDLFKQGTGLNYEHTLRKLGESSPTLVLLSNSILKGLKNRPYLEALTGKENVIIKFYRVSLNMWITAMKTNKISE